MSGPTTSQSVERKCPRCHQRFTAEISILSGPLGNFRWAQVACDQCFKELRKEKEKKTDKKGLHG